MGYPNTRVKGRRDPRGSALSAQSEGVGALWCLDVSVLGTVRDHSALRTRSQGQSMACPVQWGPHGTHRVQFTRPIDTIEHRASKMLPRARTARVQIVIPAAVAHANSVRVACVMRAVHV